MQKINLSEIRKKSVSNFVDSKFHFGVESSTDEKKLTDKNLSIDKKKYENVRSNIEKAYKKAGELKLSGVSKIEISDSKCKLFYLSDVENFLLASIIIFPKIMKAKSKYESKQFFDYFYMRNTKKKYLEFIEIISDYVIFSSGVEIKRGDLLRPMIDFFRNDGLLIFNGTKFIQLENDSLIDSTGYIPKEFKCITGGFEPDHWLDFIEHNQYFWLPENLEGIEIISVISGNEYGADIGDDEETINENNGNLGVSTVTISYEGKTYHIVKYDDDNNPGNPRDGFHMPCSFATRDIEPNFLILDSFQPDEHDNIEENENDEEGDEENDEEGDEENDEEEDEENDEEGDEENDED